MILMALCVYNQLCCYSVCSRPHKPKFNKIDHIIHKMSTPFHPLTNGKPTSVTKSLSSNKSVRDALWYIEIHVSSVSSKNERALICSVIRFQGFECRQLYSILIRLTLFDVCVIDMWRGCEIWLYLLYRVPFERFHFTLRSPWEETGKLRWWRRRRFRKMQSEICHTKKSLI